MKWESISKPPEDGMTVDLYFEGYGRVIDVVWRGREWAKLGSLTPSHWMPIPNPPKQEDDK